jgi:hypothetical protein
MPTKGEIFVQEFVLGFGFLGGLFAWVGIDPEEEIVRGFLRVAFPSNELAVSGLVILFALGSVAASILCTLAMAGKWGLLAAGLAWISGFILPIGGSWSIVGVFLLIAALFIGPAACKSS